MELCNTILERMNINYKSSNVLQEHKLNLLNPDNSKANNKIMYKLVEDLSKEPLLGELNYYIPNLIYYLWKQPKIVCKLLLNANSKDMKESLSDLFCNNFYENILSPNYIEHHLLFLITLLLKEEITKISEKNTDDHKVYLNLFLNNSSCSFILEQLIKKKDVQTFFKTILINIIEILELSSGNKELLLDLNKIEKEVLKKNKNKKSNDDNLKIDRELNETISSSLTQNNFDNEFIKKNAFPLNNNIFEKLIKKYKGNDAMNSYLLYHIDEIDKKKNIYTPELFKKLNLVDNIHTQTVNEYEKLIPK